MRPQPAPQLRDLVSGRRGSNPRRPPELKRDPRRPVHARVDNLDVEIRVVEAPAQAGAGLGDRMAAAGPWRGETEDEILEILREARRSGSSDDPPAMP